MIDASKLQQVIDTLREEVIALHLARVRQEQTSAREHRYLARVRLAATALLELEADATGMAAAREQLRAALDGTEDTRC